MPVRGNVSHDKELLHSSDPVKTTNTVCEASTLLDDKNKLKLITELLHQLNLAGLQREHEVCMAVQRVHITNFKFCSAWNTCNLTGEMCADSLHFLCDGVSYNIHKRFAYFAYCLWTCTHMAKLRQELAWEMTNLQTVSQQGPESAEAPGIPQAEVSKVSEVSEVSEASEASAALPAKQSSQDESGHGVEVQQHTAATLHTGFNVAYNYVCDVIRGTLVDFI